MRNLIVQYYDQKPLPKWAEISKNKFKIYADKVKADYLFYDEMEFCPEVPYFENLNIVYNERFMDYNNILYVDVDVIPENMEENIFDELIEDIGMIPEYKPVGMNADPFHMLPNVEMEFRKQCFRIGAPVKRPASARAPYLMFNSGVMLWSREGRMKARKRFGWWKDWYDGCDMSQLKLDQPFITSQVVKYLDYTELALKWNCFPKFRFHEGMAPKEMNFVHYTGGKKKYIEELYA
jgi:lipopolysaccharide biosynthesis glycosyltransferase